MESFSILSVVILIGDGASAPKFMDDNNKFLEDLQRDATDDKH